ncbi:MAG: hypothetical protein Q3X49_03420 [Slackia sp.]|uniref:hypothetical protein n=1 Tax=Slackia sp. TaxID=2049041 RepID=UPI002850987E|nr:hypothetical protein [Slackia sp.]MDR3900132.1 hypothetical protein [Slackia sp.]
MLYILTGDVQTGKSRWLEKHVKKLAADHVNCYGVISAGVWVESDSTRANTQGFEKRGIECILLPNLERFEFAKRTDISKKEGTFDERSQAGKAGLGWHISDEAIAQVNAHFHNIAEKAQRGMIRGVLVVDELGRLELDRGEGLVEAVRLLEEGASGSFSNALVVARSELAMRVADRFADAWGGAQIILPE